MRFHEKNGHWPLVRAKGVEAERESSFISGEDETSYPEKAVGIRGVSSKIRIIEV